MMIVLLLVGVVALSRRKVMSAGMGGLAAGASMPTAADVPAHAAIGPDHISTVDFDHVFGRTGGASTAVSTTAGVDAAYGVPRDRLPLRTLAPKTITEYPDGTGIRPTTGLRRYPVY